VAVAARGTLTGNRGILIDARRQLVRDSQVKRWIACRLEFRGRRRQVMTPGRWTELFFLDEATALAAGHRPCAECRHADYEAFQSAWRRAFADRASNADAIDGVLHRERREGPWRKRTYISRAEALPGGAMVAVDERAWLVWRDAILAWSVEGYTERRSRPVGEITVLTPPSIVGVLEAGYPVRAHPTAAA
jgi:hypothetical protein